MLCQFESGRGHHKHSLCCTTCARWVGRNKGKCMAKRKTEQPIEEPRVETVEEYLARGGEITVCPPGMRSEDVTYKTGPKSKRAKAKRKKKD